MNHNDPVGRAHKSQEVRALFRAYQATRNDQRPLPVRLRLLALLLDEARYIPDEAVDICRLALEEIEKVRRTLADTHVAALSLTKPRNT